MAEHTEKMPTLSSFWALPFGSKASYLKTIIPQGKALSWVPFTVYILILTQRITIDVLVHGVVSVVLTSSFLLECFCVDNDAFICYFLLVCFLFLSV